MLAAIGADYHGAWAFTLEAFLHPPVWLALAGLLVAWWCYIKQPALPGRIAARLGLIGRILEKKYGFDDFNQIVFAAGSRALGRFLWRHGDLNLIDGLLVNGTARGVRRLAGVARRAQSGYLYHYAFAIILGLLILLAVFAHGLLR